MGLILEFSMPSGFTGVTAELFPFGSTTIVNGTGDSCAEISQKPGNYQASVSETLSGWHDVVIKVGGDPFANYRVFCTDGQICRATDEMPFGNVAETLIFGPSDGSTVTSDYAVYYGSLTDANIYFDARLNSDAWEDASASDKEKALTMATRAIDRLNFVDAKTVSTQKLQFPRGTATTVPDAIKIATYEEALLLLDGHDQVKEQKNVSVVSHSFSSVRTTYDRTFVADHIAAGIISSIAWAYLQPFLRDPHELILSRVN